MNMAGLLQMAVSRRSEFGAKVRDALVGFTLAAKTVADSGTALAAQSPSLEGQLRARIAALKDEARALDVRARLIGAETQLARSRQRLLKAESHRDLRTTGERLLAVLAAAPDAWLSTTELHRATSNHLSGAALRDALAELVTAGSIIRKREKATRDMPHPPMLFRLVRQAVSQ